MSEKGMGMKGFAILSLLLLLAGNSMPAAAEDAAPLTAQQMIAALDKADYPGQPFRVTSTLVNYVKGAPRDTLSLVIFSRVDKSTGQYDNLAGYTQPVRDQGKILLMEGSKMYFYDPFSKASVRLSPQQTLIGQASNADVMAVNYARDYKASLSGAETIDDADKKSCDCWHIDLAASNDEAVYSRMEFWLEKGSYHLIKGKYYSDSGRLLKLAYFRKYEMSLGTPRAGEVILIDAVDPSLVTTMNYIDRRLQNIPDSWFQQDYLPHLKLD
jgi:Outer membrane lipoprotein-sorting protein